jgi:signal transduction histidine kinase/ligand-binding sensor domain-containing protein
MRLISLLTLLVFTCCSQAIAQWSDIFSSYGIDDGLPQSSIWSIAQDRNGFLWVGTSDGVCRFDGYNFTTYRNDPNDSNSIFGGLYFRFYKDSANTLWVISQNGISLYNDIQDRFTKIFSYNKEYGSTNYSCIFGEDAQYIWAGVADYGLVKIDKRTHKMISVKNVVFSGPPQIPSWQSGFICKGKIWISGSNATCYVYDIITGKIDTTHLPLLYKMVDYNDSEVFAATLKNVILINKRTLRHKIIPYNYGDQPDGVATDIFIASGTEIVISSAYGLTYLDSRTFQMRRHIQSFTQGQKHSYTYVQCIYRDYSGNLWLGTNGGGLKKITAPYRHFKFYTSYSDGSNLVKAIYADRRNIYVGYFDNGLDIFRRDSGFIKNVSMHTLHSPQNDLHAITALDSNNLIFNLANQNFIYDYSLTGNRSLSLSPISRQILPGFKTMENSFPFFLKTDNIIYTLFKDYVISFDASTPTNIKPAILYQFTGESLKCAFKDSRGTIWAGSDNGVFYVNKGEAVKVALPEAVMAKTINEDAQGNIWIGTIRGIFVLDSNKKIQKFYGENNGLPNQFIYGILRDDDGNMWFSHNKGLSVYKYATNTFRHYTKEDGLQSNEFNTGAFFKADNGELFFGGINGTNSFYPNEVGENSYAPAVTVTSIKLFDEPLKSDTTYWNIHTLTLPYTQNSLSFEFAELEFTNPKNNRYAYIMDGLDNTWINAGDKRFARYAALPPGRYTFKVKAANNDGKWQANPTTILINIIPPFWQRVWFRLLCITFFIVCIGSIIILIQRIRHRKQIRLRELQQKIQLERERISRDLHDNVGTQLSLISNNIEWVAHPLKVISEHEKAEKLQFANDSVRDIITTLRETIWALNKQQISLEEFSDKLKAFVQKQLSIYPQIELNYTEEIGQVIILGPSEALDLFRICQEAITNALKYAKAAVIDLKIQSKDGKYKIAVSDNGEGFDLNKVNSSVQNGLENMRYRARDIGCLIEINTLIDKGTSIVILKK